MKITENQLRKLVQNETKKMLLKNEGKKSKFPTLKSLFLEAEGEENKDQEKSSSKFSQLTAGTNIKDVDPSDVYKQLVSRDGNAPIFKAMADAKPKGFNIDPEKCADHYETIGEKEFINRLSAIQNKIPSKGLPKDQMPVLPNPNEKGIQGTVDQLEDILKPGGDYNVDFEGHWHTGPRLFERWGRLAGILTEKIDPPGANAIKGGSDDAKKYLKGGLEDGDESDDNIPFEAPGKIVAKSAIPTQTNILIGKTIGMATPKDAGGGGVEGGPIGAYGGTDGEILDGHHRWAAMMISNPGATMGTVMNIDLAAVGSGDKKSGLKQLTAIGNALGNPTKTENKKRR